MNFYMMFVLLKPKTILLLGYGASSEPFYASYNHTRWFGAIPVDLHNGGGDRLGIAKVCSIKMELQNCHQ